MALYSIIVFFAMFLSAPDPRIGSALEAFIGPRTAASHEIVYKSVPRELTSIDHGSSVRIVDEPRASYRGRMNLGVEIVPAAGGMKRYTLGITVRTFETVAVATAMIDRHQDLAGGQRVLLQECETTQLSGEPVTSTAEFEGTRSRQIIQAGKIVTRSMIEQLPVVRSGAGVTLRVKKDNVRVTIGGKAREDGWIGSIIDVDIQGMQKRTLRARVVGASEVEAVE